MCTYSSNVDKKNYHNSSIISYLILKYKEHRDEKKIYIYNRRFDAIFSPTAVSRSPIFEGFSAIRWFSRTLDVIYIYACIWTRVAMPRVTQQQRTKGGDLGVYVRLLPTVYIMPPLPSSRRPFTLSPDRPPSSNSPHRPYSPHRYSLPAPLGISQRRCRVLHNSRAPLPVFYRRHATLPS